MLLLGIGWRSRPANDEGEGERQRSRAVFSTDDNTSCQPNMMRLNKVLFLGHFELEIAQIARSERSERPYFSL